MTIEPLSQVPPEAVRNFLVAQDHEPEVIDWKYYDQEFNQGRERGFVGLVDGKIVSFLGLIPFTVMHDGKPVEAAWSCDWYRDAAASGPLGILLMRRSLLTYPLIYSSGGSEMTRAIMSKLCRLTFPNHGLELYKPLRVGGALHLFRRAYRFRFPSLSARLTNIRLPRRVHSSQQIATRFSTGIPDALKPLLNEQSRAGHTSAWQLGDLRWHLERCPIITAQVCLVSRDQDLTAAVVFWQPTGDPRMWRLCLLPGRGDYAALEAGVRNTIEHIRQAGGWLVSLLISRLDEENLQLARKLGFYASHTRRPLYILTSSNDPGLRELDRLSYLDTDYAYRFPTIKV